MKSPFGQVHFGGEEGRRAKNKHESGMEFSVEVISSPKAILKHEVERVRWYVDNYDHYKKLDYKLQLPSGIDPEQNKSITDEQIKSAIESEFDQNLQSYKAYARELEETWGKMSSSMLASAQKVYGIPLSGEIRLIPTAYGTGGGSLEKDGVIFFRLPTFRPEDETGNRISEIEAVTHEVLAHEATAKIREGTLLDDSVFGTHHWHKEHLLNLLGRTLLVRSGLMERDQVRMDGYAAEQAAADIDAIYYSNPNNPSEDNLRFEGNLQGLIEAIEEKLKSKSQ